MTTKVKTRIAKMAPHTNKLIKKKVLRVSAVDVLNDRQLITLEALVIAEAAKAREYKGKQYPASIHIVQREVNDLRPRYDMPLIQRAASIERQLWGMLNVAICNFGGWRVRTENVRRRQARRTAQQAKARVWMNEANAKDKSTRRLTVDVHAEERGKFSLRVFIPDTAEKLVPQVLASIEDLEIDLDRMKR